MGLAPLNILAWDFDETYIVGDVGDDDDHDSDGTFDKNTSTGNFTLYGMPSSIRGQGSVALAVNFNPTVNGDFKTNLTIYTNGGNSSVLLTGSADGAAVMHINLDQYDGKIANDSTYMDFGNVLPNSVHTQLLRVQNSGQSTLTLTKSKPPAGPLIYALNPATKLTEGYTIAANTEATAALQLTLRTSQVNQDSYNTTSQWVLNGNDPNFGVHFVQMSARVITPQLGPLQNVSQPDNVNGTGRYRYLGCYSDNAGARTFGTTINLNQATFENGACMKAGAALNGLGNFVGTEYGQECYASAQPPPLSKKADDVRCDHPCNGDSTQICGGSSYMSVFYDVYAYNATSGTLLSGAFPGAATVPNVTTAGGQTYLSSGCINDNAGNRALKAASYVDKNNMTVESCASFCGKSSYKYFSVDLRNDDHHYHHLEHVHNIELEHNHHGSSSGHDYHFSKCSHVHHFNNCNHNYNVLDNVDVCECHVNVESPDTDIPSLTNQTVEQCTAQCTAAGFTIAGVEYGVECWCGNLMASSAVNQTSDAPCNMACSGNTNEKCGAGNLMNVYSNQVQLQPIQSATVGSFSSLGCYNDTSNARILQGAQPVLGQNTTLENCAQKCAGFTYFGVEYANECYCGNTLLNYAAQQTQTDSTTSSTTSSSSSTTSSSSSPAAPAATGFTALGCYLDEVNARSLSYTAYQNNKTNTVDGCSATCRSKGYRFSGTEYGGECYCDNFLLNNAYSSGPGATGCTYLCSGNSSQVCGGSGRINIVQDTTWKQQLFTVNQSGKWTFNDCYADSSSARVLNVTLYQNNYQSTVETCLFACAAKNLTVCGVQYGNECYGSVALPSTSAKAPAQGANDPLERGCSFKCAGNSTQACGGSSRMNVFTFNPKAASISPSTVLIAAAT
ncbi:hypothetical protein NDA16_002585 [Ustilago loliicola]|nr:hypothetical protein NDA16_002585 [Ustilago loliicola]